MQAKYWLSIASCVVVTAVVGCGDDSDNGSPGTAGSSSTAGAGGANAAGSGGGGTSAAGTTSGGSSSAGNDTGGTGAGGSAGTAAGGSGGSAGSGAGAGAGEAGGDAGGAAGAGGEASGRAGGEGGGGTDSGGEGAGGSGGTGSGGDGGGGDDEENPSALCDRELWKYTFQLCPHSNYNIGDNEALRATDGNPLTFVTSGAPQNGTAYAVFDLHGSVDVESVTLDYAGSGKNGDASALLKLQGSNDGVTYTDLTGEVSGVLTGDKVTVPLVGGDRYRFIKVLQVGTSGSWWAIPEIDIACGAGTLVVPADAGVATDRSQWKITTPNSLCASFENQDVPVTNMVDADDMNSAWQSVGRPDVGYWVSVDMGAKAELKGVHLTHRPGDFPPTLKVQVSNDGVHFTDAAAGVAGAQALTVTFAEAQNVRFFRILSEQITQTAWWSITDLDIDI